jgi:hypothetical protein
VNPPWQRFGALGGIRRVETILWDGRVLTVDGRAVLPLEPPAGCGAAAFAHGEITTYLARGTLPSHPAATDPFGYASAALAFDVALGPGAIRDVYLAVPFGTADAREAASLAGVSAPEACAAARAAGRAGRRGSAASSSSYRRSRAITPPRSAPPPRTSS